MGALKRFFSSWWGLTGLAAVLAAAVLALALPIVWAPVRPGGARLVLVLLVALVWAGFAAARVLRARRAAAALAAELQSSQPGEAEAAALAERMRAALEKLRTASSGRRDYLYARPWYVIIGPPGAGKTTALVNSGLRFPVAETSLKGVGGTRDLDFWFADEAVLVDTAGRYTTQESDAEADSRGWARFLALLRKHRPLQPINGVLVAIGVDELLRADRAGLDAHASAVRQRLTELRRALEVEAPVYLLITKADLLAGFAEFFEDLDVEGRRAVLGETFPWPAEALGPADLAEAVDGLVQAAADRSPKRLQEETDPRRRSLILGYPPQLTGLRNRLMRFADGLLAGHGLERPALRGLYFTSGVQEGTPLDRILAGVSEAYAQPAPAAARRGRAFFLNRLLTEVVIPEAGLVQSDPKARARRLGMIGGGLAAIAALAAIVIALWGVSFAENRRLQGRLSAAAQEAQQTIRASGLDLQEVRGSDPDLEQALPTLRALRRLPRGYADQRRGGPPLTMRFGLYQSADAQAARQAYLEALQRIMLPRILLRLEQVLRAEQQDPLALYEPLKIYLMLGGQGPLNRAAVKAWVERDWETASLPGADRAAVRAELAQHLDALLADPQLGRVWPARQAPLDGALIASSRAAVQTLSLADRAYAIMRERAATGPAWRADAVLASGDARAFRNGEAVLGLSVPYFYTRAGFERAYQLGFQTVELDLKRDLWVFGPDAGKTAVQAQLEGVRPGVAALYAKDYIAAWEAVAKAPLPADYFHDPAALAVLTRNPSPLKLLLLEVRRNTQLAGEARAATGLQSRLAAAIGGTGAVPSTGGADAGLEISTAFKPLAAYVGDGRAVAPLDDFLAALKTAGAAQAAAGVAGGGLGGAAAQGQLASAVGAVAAQAAGAPPLLQGFIAQAAHGGQQAAVSSAQGAVAQAYQQMVLPACRSVVDGRYPFVRTGADAAVPDMLRVFGASGTFDSFMRDQLASLLDGSGPVWRWKSGDPVAGAFDPSSASALQKAGRARDLLAAGLPLKVELASVAGAVRAVELSSGGQTWRFETAASGAKPLMWSAISGLPEAHLVLYQGAHELKRFDAQGPWALFRLMDQARIENAGATALKATFGQGADVAVLRVDLPTEQNPFGRGGAWSFRCPAKL